MTTEAQKRAQKNYDRKSREKFKVLTLKLNKESDSDILAKLENTGNMQGYIKSLIRADINK